MKPETNAGGPGAVTSPRKVPLTRLVIPAVLAAGVFVQIEARAATGDPVRASIIDCYSYYGTGDLGQGGAGGAGGSGPPPRGMNNTATDRRFRVSFAYTHDADDKQAAIDKIGRIEFCYTPGALGGGDFGQIVCPATDWGPTGTRNPWLVFDRSTDYPGGDCSKEIRASIVGKCPVYSFVPAA